MPVNIVIDFAMLVAMALVSISGFILEVVIPSRHAVRMHGADSWCSHLCGLGRHGWGDVHLWAGEKCGSFTFYRFIGLRYINVYIQT